MAYKVLMPKLGMMEGDLSVVEWKVKAGDTVEKGQALCTVEGQKITNDVESEIAGVVRGIYVQPGDPCKIGTVIAIVADADEDISALVPSASAGQAAPSATVVSAAPPVQDEEDGPKASPSAKALAKEKNVKLSKIASALGISRRITVFDVERYLEEFKALEPKSKESRLTGMRKVIAIRMLKSSNETAPVSMARYADVTELVKSRESRKAEFKAAGKPLPSYNDLVIKAAALALKQHPTLNATYEDEVIYEWENININMAVSVDAGLTVPVIRDADKKNIFEINAAAKDLAERATKNKLTGDELAGGTFTVTNLGMFGIEVSTPIINLPEVAILGVGTIKPRLVLEDGKVVEKQEMGLSLTVDHRIIDGAPGAEFLKTVVAILAEPEQLWA